MNNKLLLQFTVVALIAGLIGGGISGKLQNYNSNNGSSNTQIVQERHYVEESDSISAIEKVAPSVLSIVATKDLQVLQDPFQFFGPFGMMAPQQGQQDQQNQKNQPTTQRKQVSGGTGFVVSADGLSVTNKHVVADAAADYTAVSSDGTKYDVEVISRDPVNDLALVQLHVKSQDETTDTSSDNSTNSNKKTDAPKNFGAKPEKLPFVELADASKLKVGQKVFAIGNARGEYENSVTGGIISAIGREIDAGDARGGFHETLTGLIQTDAAINFGNSGGPLINLDGEVIGVNTAVDSGATSVGFAIPANQVIPAVESVKKFGKIVRPFLGVQHIILNKQKAKELKLDGIEYGALITGDRSKKDFGVIAGGPADKAGLKLDDIILEVDGAKITEDNTLQSVVQKHVPNDTLTLKVQRNGSQFDVKVTLDERKE